MSNNRRRNRRNPRNDGEKRPVGAPPIYRPEFARQAERLCKLGATDADLADFFEVTIRTIERWKSARKDFGAAVIDGKEKNDERVVRAIYHRAVGYTHDAEKIMQHQGRVIRAKHREHHAPDVQAAIFWLTNRQPDAWRHKQELTGPGGGPLQTIDVTGLTPVERQQRIASLVMMNGGAGPVVDAKPEPAPAGA